VNGQNKFRCAAKLSGHLKIMTTNSARSKMRLNSIKLNFLIRFRRIALKVSGVP